MPVESIGFTGEGNKSQRCSLSGFHDVQQALGPQNTYDALGPVLFLSSFGYYRHDQPISQRWKLRSGVVKRFMRPKVREHLIL